MATRVRDAEATRARILEAAVSEFARYGLAGARGERIAQRARSSERMVYYYFGSKEGLYREALEHVYVSLRQAERSLDLDGLEPAAALSVFCRFVWRYYLEHPEFIGLVNAENLQRARQLHRSARLPELVSPVVELLRGLLARGERSGIFRAGIDAAELYVAIAGLGYFYLSNSYTLSAVLGRGLREPARLEAHWRSSEEMIMRFVRPDFPERAAAGQA
ncbi:TetR family transcriptional regulator [Quisquiliibacterium transsilvanicum]|uniref:AcrR family transcriptional regulator n=1 Tax=Quisquiliibacterium transsilvanicum TaxID=1549638 RepID=A0A7W8HF71_9BURK|nr:TetR family transcriptional regulator [Quisquiliibacterium transsilvanicum]MBB5270994.1 AcrR family transcriptional regulator [Quisquiliibacterium transsilvanicum]